MKPFLQAALAAAEAAAEDIMHYYRGNFEVELKPDQTPVTVADRRAEEIIKGILLKIGGMTLYRRARPFFLGLLLGYVLGVGLCFLVDVIWFPSHGHMIHHW